MKKHPLSNKILISLLYRRVEWLRLSSQQEHHLIPVRHRMQIKRELYIRSLILQSLRSSITWLNTLKNCNCHWLTHRKRNLSLIRKGITQNNNCNLDQCIRGEVARRAINSNKFLNKTLKWRIKIHKERKQAWSVTRKY